MILQNRISFIALLFVLTGAHIKNANATSYNLSGSDMTFFELLNSMVTGDQMVLSGAATYPAAITTNIAQDKSVTIIGTGTNTPVLDFSSSTTSISLTGEDNTTEITHLILSGQMSSKGFAIVNNSQNLVMNDVQVNGTGGISNGGDLHITNSSLSNNGGNTYGAIVSSANGNVTIGNTTFDGNTATTSGGAIMMGTGATGDGVLTINGGTTFKNNSAGNGGAIYAYSDMELNTNTGDIIFDNNSAGEGGAIAFSINSTVTLTSENGNDLIFRNNKSTTTTVPAGGAILSTGTLHLDSAAGNIIFENNSVAAPSSGVLGGVGGAILNYIGLTTISVANGYELKFDGNTAATDGGAIYNGTLDGLAAPEGFTTELIIGNNAIFTNNTAGGNGGAIYNYDNTILTIGDDVVFQGNHADSMAGAIYANAGSKVTIGDGATFDGNTSLGGGAIMTSEANFTIGTGATFINNSTTVGTGGAIYNYKSLLTLNPNTTFQGNISGTAGGAISNQSGGTLTFASDVTGGYLFDGNSATGTSYGAGAIFNSVSTINMTNIAGDIKFTNNSATANGGAIYNMSTGALVNISAADGYTTTFEGNTAGINGGAIASQGSAGTEDTTAINITGDTVFKNNTSNTYGGAIYLSASTMNLNSDGLGTLDFSGNKSVNLEGGAIYMLNNSILNIGGNTTFSGNTAGTSGGAIYFTSGTLNLDSSNGDIEFTDNMATNYGGAIYNFGDTLNIINTNGNIKFDGNSSGIAGGAISNAGILTIGGGSEFVNNSTTYYGGAIYNDNILILDTTYGGDINFSNNTSQMGGDIYNDITLNIIGTAGTSINLNSATGIHNDGKATISKTGENTLNITGQATGSGEFKQTAGVTIAQSGFFTGGTAKTNISNSSLSVKHNSYDYGVTLGQSGSLIHTNINGNQNTISNSNLVFEDSANNATAIFNALTGVTTSYNLATAIDNGGTGNVLGIEGSNVTLGLDNYLGTTTYVFTNDTINLSGPSTELRTITFDYLKATNTTLSFDLYANPSGSQEMFTSDRLVVNNPDAENPAEFKLGSIRMVETADNGLDSFAFDNILDGAKFAAGGKASIATTAYLYDVTVNGALTGLDLTVAGPSGYNSLNNMNIDIDSAVSRGFNFSFFKGPQTYNIDESLGVMAAGDFTVTGYSNNAADSVISGYLREITTRDNNDKATAWGDVTETRGSMFKITDNATSFTLSNLTIANTFGSNGGAINITNSDAVVNLSNLIFDDNHANSNGGAIYTRANLAMNNDMVFKNNQAPNMGGAISAMGISGEDLNITFGGNTMFTNNGTTSSGYSYGGALFAQTTDADTNVIFYGDAIFKNNYVTGLGDGAAMSVAASGENSTATIEFHGDNIEFSGNTAANGGYGGAITVSGYNADVKFNMNENTKIKFENNTDSVGGNDILVNGTNRGYIYFSGTGGTADINGGIADRDGLRGTDTNEDSAVFVSGDVTVNFNESSVNENFHGRYIQNGGTTNIYTTSWIGKGSGESDGLTLIMNGKMNIFNSLDTHTMAVMSGGTLDIRGFKPTDSEIQPLARAATAGSDITIGNVGQYNTLTMEQFVGGGGNIWLNTNGSIAGTDKIVITNAASGDAILNFGVIGNNPVDKKIEVVDYSGADSNASFKLVGDTLDIGAWEYKLVNEVNDGWYLQAEDLNSTAQSVMGIPALHLSMVKTGMNELRKRLGALRNDNDNDELVGAWVRGYGKHLNIHELVNAEMNIAGIEGGIDFKAEALNGKMYFGIMGGMLDSEDIEFNTSVGKASGWTRTPSVGAYLTWMHKSDSTSKWFVDLTARHFWAHTHVEKEDKTNGYDVTRNFWAFSAETGKLFYMESPEWMNIGDIQHSHVSIEPKLELRYKRGSAEDFETFAHDQGHVDKTESLSTHLNLQMNFLPNGTVSIWRPYIELGVYNEFMGNTELNFSDTKLCSSDTKGLGLTATLGTNANVSDNTYVYGGYTFETGKVYTSHQLNIGIRTKF